MDASTVRAWAAAAARALAQARGPIDSLNVFPVPDGDTGTNLALTVGEGAEHVADHVTGADPHADAIQVAAAFARGALLGARGNSGIIVSQYLHGFAAGLASGDDAPGARMAAALDEAQRAARAAVARPVEGTILTAATAAAEAAGVAARAGGGAEATTAAAVRGAREALARSPQALDVLRDAGVVDAGASGLVVMLEALAAVVRGAELRTAEMATVVARTVGDPPPEDPWATAGAVPGAEDGEFEVMFVVEPHRPGAGRTDLAPELQARMQAIGGSVAVVGGEEGWHVHVHTDQPARAVAEGGEVGAQSQVVVRRLAGLGRYGADLGVVVGTGAPDLVADLARSGALVMVLTGWPVGPRDVLRSIVDTGAARVVVLPGSPSAHAAARAAADLADVPVEVLDADDDARVVVAVTAAAGPGTEPEPGGSGTDGGAAPAVRADDGSGAVGAMRRALAGVRTLAVDVATPAAVLGVVRGLLDGGGELVTVVAGADLTAGGQAHRLEHDLTTAVQVLRPEVEVVVVPGGQGVPAAVVAVE